MAYTKTNWVSGETPLSAANLNNIEQGIADLDGKVPTVISQTVNVGTVSASGSASSAGVAISGVPSGKTAVGIVGWALSGSNYTGIIPLRISIQSGKIAYVLRNTYTSAATGVTLTLSILCV